MTTAEHHAGKTPNMSRFPVRETINVPEESNDRIVMGRFNLGASIDRLP